jgi:imidazoleglycerol-phosphate dehydratase
MTDRSERVATVTRETRETKIRLELGVDGALGDGRRERQIEVPNGFFGHMLDALFKHGGFAVDLSAEGDTFIDLHHTVEDTGIVVGEALFEALGERRGMRRFATAYAPLDEALARAVVDFSGRGFLVYDLPPAVLGAWVTRDFPLTLVEDFLQALADRGRFTLHLDVLRGRNPHHVAEASFKALALALRAAVEIRSGDASVPSTKGTLSQ